MTENKKSSLFALGLILCILLLFVLLRFMMTVNDGYGELLLVQENGTVYLKQNEKIVDRFSDIEVESLPAKDRFELQNGIIVSSREDALKRIEDYDG